MEITETIASLNNNASNEGDRRNYVRCKLQYEHNGDLHASVFTQQGSHMVSSMVSANGIAVIDPKESFSRGDKIRVQIFGKIANA